MAISRRNLLFNIWAGTMVGTTFPRLGARYLSVTSQSSLAGRGDGLIRLDKNENPYGPSAMAITAMREALSHAHRFPDAQALREKIAGFHRVKPEEVVLGCGSSEILHMASTEFLGPGKNLILG